MFDTDVTEPLDDVESGGEWLAGLDGRVAALNQGLLAVLDAVAGIDVDDLWMRCGAASVTDLLTGRYGASAATARDWQRVAGALEGLPAIRAVFASGGLSWEQLREVTRVAAADTDAEWALVAQEMSAREIRAERLPPSKRSVDNAHRDRTLRWWFDGRKPEFHLTMTCPDVEGAVIATALQRRAGQAEPDPHTGVYEAFESRCADALWQIASEALADERDADRATVLVTTTLDHFLNSTANADDASTGGDAAGRLVGGPVLLPETLKRLMCDARLQVTVEGGDGTTVGVGRTMRTPPPALRRVVVARDGGCRFPRCRRTRWVHVHHLVHWAHGGPTDLDNLITLCVLHHRLIHDGGWTVSGDPNDEVTWVNHHGRIHRPGPPTPDDLIKRRVIDTLPDITPPQRPNYPTHLPP